MNLTKVPFHNTCFSIHKLERMRMSQSKLQSILRADETASRNKPKFSLLGFLNKLFDYNKASNSNNTEITKEAVPRSIRVEPVTVSKAQLIATESKPTEPIPIPYPKGHIITAKEPYSSESSFQFDLIMKERGYNSDNGNFRSSFGDPQTESPEKLLFKFDQDILQEEQTTPGSQSLLLTQPNIPICEFASFYREVNVAGNNGRITDHTQDEHMGYADILREAEEERAESRETDVCSNEEAANESQLNGYFKAENDEETVYVDSLFSQNRNVSDVSDSSDSFERIERHSI